MLNHTEDTGSFYWTLSGLSLVHFCIAPKGRKYQKQCGQQNYGNDCYIVLATGETVPGMLGSVLGPLLQEGY